MQTLGNKSDNVKHGVQGVNLISAACLVADILIISASHLSQLLTVWESLYSFSLLCVSAGQTVLAEGLSGSRAYKWYTVTLTVEVSGTGNRSRASGSI